MTDPNPFGASDNPFGSSVDETTSSYAPPSASASAPKSDAVNPWGVDEPHSHAPAPAPAAASTKSPAGVPTAPSAGAGSSSMPQGELSCPRRTLNACGACCGGCNHGIAQRVWLLLIVLSVLCLLLVSLFGTSFAYFTPEPASEKCDLDCSKDNKFACSSLPAGCLVLVQDLGGGDCTCHDVCSVTNFNNYRPVSFSAQLGGTEASVFCPPPTNVNTWRITLTIGSAAWLLLVCVAVYRAWSAMWLFATVTALTGGLFLYVMGIEANATLGAEKECSDKYANSAAGGAFAFEPQCNYAFANAFVLCELALALLLLWAASLTCIYGRNYAGARASSRAMLGSANAVQV